MSSISFKTISYIGLIGFSGLSYALDPIPTEDGFSGYINMAVAGI